LAETAEPVWTTAAACEERIAPLLEILGRESEAALHRISAAGCYERCGDPSRAANLYRAALAGPITDAAKEDVQKRLSACFKRLQRDTAASVAWSRSVILSDLPLLEEMEKKLRAEPRFSTLFETVVLSPQFRKQRGRDYVAASQ
jgi:hypothetical protein